MRRIAPLLLCGMLSGACGQQEPHPIIRTEFFVHASDRGFSPKTLVIPREGYVRVTFDSVDDQHSVRFDHPRERWSWATPKEHRIVYDARTGPFYQGRSGHLDFYAKRGEYAYSCIMWHGRKRIAEQGVIVVGEQALAKNAER